jgi:CBS-domain-containing membrane protein
MSKATSKMTKGRVTQMRDAETAKDIMTMKVVTVKPSTSIEDAARLLVRRKISGVPVVDEKDKTKVVGILTEADLLAAPSGAKTVADVMKKRVVSVSPDTPVDEIAEILVKKKIKRVPVIDAGKLVGIVSRIDVLRAISIPRQRNWDWWRSIVGIGRGPGGAVSEEHDKWVYVKDWEERDHR